MSNLHNIFFLLPEVPFSELPCHACYQGAAAPTGQSQISVFPGDCHSHLASSFFLQALFHTPAFNERMLSVNHEACIFVGTFLFFKSASLQRLGWRQKVSESREQHRTHRQSKHIVFCDHMPCLSHSCGTTSVDMLCFATWNDQACQFTQFGARTVQT